MKHKNLLRWVVAGLVIIISAKSTVSYSQSRTRKLPDGTIIYADGTIKRTDGTTKYPDGRIKQVDGSIKYPDGTILSPGKKSLKPVAPSQQDRKPLINDSSENKKVNN